MVERADARDLSDEQDMRISYKLPCISYSNTLGNTMIECI